MPWSEVTVVNQRTRFVADAERGVFTMTELCRRYGIGPFLAFEKAPQLGVYAAPRPGEALNAGVKNPRAAVLPAAFGQCLHRSR